MDEWQKLIQAETDRIRQQDIKMMNKGFTHRVTHWNHRTGGDDIQSDTYFSSDPTTLTREDDAYSIWRRIIYEALNNDFQVFELAKILGEK